MGLAQTTTKQAERSPRSRWLWPIQAFVAIVAGATGLMKAGMPLAWLAAEMPWVSAMPSGLVRGIGLTEVAGAAGLLVPGALGRFPGVPRLAAGGLAVLMIATALFQWSIAAHDTLVTTIVLGVLCAFVAWKRSCSPERESAHP